METPVLGNVVARRAGWTAVLTVATIAGSFVFACATPFPALATLAPVRMNRRDAFALTAVILAVSAFGAPVILAILKVNLAAFAGLLLIQYLGGKMGLAAPRYAVGQGAVA